MSTRRHFIRQAGIAGASLGFFGLSGIPAWAESEDMQLFGAEGLNRLPRATPESQGVSSEAIRQFIKAANASGISWHSFMLLRHGKVVAEGWWKPYEPQLVHTLYSLSKSFTSTAIGLLVKEGKLDVHAKLISFFPDDLPATVSDNLRAITVKHVLTMNTGHGEDTMPKLGPSKDSWVRTYLAQPVQYAPGTHFLYNTGNTYMLGAIVYKLTGKTLEEYLGPRLFEPLGITGYDWEKSPQGLNTAGYGLRVRTEDIACLGQLYLQKGKWKDAQILTPAWVDEATSSQTTSQVNNGDWSEGYGYQFWRCTHGFYRGDGAFGQYCIVMPQLDAVLAVTSQTPDMQKSLNIIWDHIPGGMNNGGLPENGARGVMLKKELGALSLPVVKGSMSPAMNRKYDSKRWKIDGNDFGVGILSFSLSEKSCVLTVSADGQETNMEFGWEKWISNPSRLSYPFQAKAVSQVQSRIAGTATWIDDKTLQLNVRFIEQIFGDRIRCVFDGDNLSVSFLISVAEMATKPTPDQRKGLEGKIA